VDADLDTLATALYAHTDDRRPCPGVRGGAPGVQPALVVDPARVAGFEYRAWVGYCQHKAPGTTANDLVESAEYTKYGVCQVMAAA
jgi:hypothetical protein